MAHNKVVLGNEIIIDMTDADVTSAQIKSGVKAYDQNGDLITGELVGGTLIVDDGQCGESVYWELHDDGTLYIRGEGATYNYTYDTAPFRSKSIKRIVIENGVKSLGEYIFNFCNVCESVTVADSVESICFAAFYNCASIKSISIGSGIKTITDYAFERCYDLETVFYNGTRTEWDDIKKNDGMLSPLIDAAFHCKYEDASNADTVDGWHFSVKEGSTPDSTTEPTITLLYTVG